MAVTWSWGRKRRRKVGAVTSTIWSRKVLCSSSERPGCDPSVWSILKSPVDVILAVVRPLVAVLGQIAEIGKPCAAVLGGGLRRFIRAFVEGNRVKQAFKEGAKLGIGRSPIAARVRLDPLVEMPERFREAEVLEQFVHLVIHRWQAEFRR